MHIADISDANKDHLVLTQGVFLHILADTLGSAGVIVSAILMWAFGWMIADPICSIFIAILIAMSVWALLADSVAILMQRTPKQLDHQLADCYQRVMQLEGVQGVHEQVWTQTISPDLKTVEIKLTFSALLDLVLQLLLWRGKIRSASRLRP